MFSGKSEELIRRVRRARIARLNTAVFKHDTDVRYSADHVVSHSDWRVPAQPVHASRQILEFIPGPCAVVAIDEAHFFDDGLAPIALQLAAAGTRVMIAGLDLDYRGEPFGPMPQLLALAESVTKTHAICVICGADAHFSQRLVASAEQVLVGAADFYEARCRQCFIPGGRASPRAVTTSSCSLAPPPGSGLGRPNKS
jgi:thymidine kinase